MSDLSLIKEELYVILVGKGAKLIGTADLSDITSGKMKTGISVAVPVPKRLYMILRMRRQKSIMMRIIPSMHSLTKLLRVGQNFL